jgi:hypothetical protein
LLLEILDALESESPPESPSSASNPAASPSSATNSAISSPATNAPAQLSQQTFLLSEFLENHSPIPQPQRQALLHGHCHHKSLMKMTAEESLLRRLGIDFHSPAPGCCGMAGSFGFERDNDKYEISKAIGELELLPAVRNAPADCLIIADGFSCREQISQLTNRRACTSPKSYRWRWSHPPSPPPLQARRTSSLNPPGFASEKPKYAPR